MSGTVSCKTPDELCDYLDEIDSPWVGSYFDIGNAQKFAPSEEWILKLGSRIAKLDVKGLGRPRRSSAKLAMATSTGLPFVLRCTKIGYTGWCTAEVGGGGKERLADIAARLDRVLTLRK